MTTAIQDHPTTARRTAGRPRRGNRASTERTSGAGAAVVADTPRITTVFHGPDGKLHHARCGRTMELVRIRGGIEFDFHCLACWEHVTLTKGSLAHVPVVVTTT